MFSKKKSKKFFLSEYILWIFKQYHEAIVQKEKTSDFRIIEVSENIDDSPRLTIQIVGKNSIFKSTPRELTKDEAMLNHFSRRDVRMITQMEFSEKILPKYKIVSYEFCSHLNKIMFSVKSRRESGVDAIEMRNYSAESIFADKEVISNLSQEDALAVGYIVGAEKAQCDFNEILELRLKQKQKYKIIAQEFCEKIRKMIFFVLKCTDKKIIQKTPEQLLIDQEIQEGLTAKENVMIGYAAGMRRRLPMGFKKSQKPEKG
jgi:hypothetical protein